MTHTTMQDDTGEAVDPQWTEPLWNWERIDIEMGKAYKAHGYTYQFIWVRELLRQVCGEYERDRDNFAAVQAYYIGVVERKDATIATQAARIVELERELSMRGKPIPPYDIIMAMRRLCDIAEAFSDQPQGYGFSDAEAVREWIDTIA